MSMTNKSLLAVAVAVALLAGCKKQADDVATTADPAVAETTAVETPEPVADTAEPAAESVAAEPAVAAFDINTIPLSDKELPEWPYVVLPAGYEFRQPEKIAANSKDLARVALWTGGELLWVEGKTFSDRLKTAEGKTFSKFELRKNLQQAIEALGGVRIGERSFERDIYKANEKPLEDFRREFDDIRDAYWYGNDADTYVIRRADKAIWVVSHLSNGSGGVLVAEGPLPEAPAE